MGKVFLNQFKAKLAKKIGKVHELANPSYDASINSTKIDYEDFSNKRNQLFISYLSNYLLDQRIRKVLIKVNPYTVRFGSFSRSNDYGTESAFHVTLSLLDLSKDGVESWECIIYECDDISENEVKTTSFDNGQIAVEYFVNQITKLYKK